MKNKLLCGNALDVLKELPDESADMALTSPPYWGPRNYKTDLQMWGGNPDCEHDFLVETKGVGDLRYRGKKASVGNNADPDIYEGSGTGYKCVKCGSWKGELGLEPHFKDYIEHLCNIFDEVKRVLTPYGSLFVVLGDTYVSGRMSEVEKYLDGKSKYLGERHISPQRQIKGYRQKCLAAIPDRFKIAMIDRDWICRNDIIWQKNNAVPSPAKDRFTIDYERVLFFVKSNKTLYWTNEKILKLTICAPKGISGKENIDWEWRDCPKCIDGCIKCEWTGKVNRSLWTGHHYYFEQQIDPYTTPLDRWGGDVIDDEHGISEWSDETGQPLYRKRNLRPNSEGRNKRCVWSVNTVSSTKKHYAMYPPKLVKTPIRAACPKEVCVVCKMPRVPIYRYTASDKNTSYEFAGLSECSCVGEGTAEYRRGVVIDPFFGTGTTGMVATAEGRNYVGIDLSPDYIEIARKQLSDLFSEV